MKPEDDRIRVRDIAFDIVLAAVVLVVWFFLLMFVFNFLYGVGNE